MRATLTLSFLLVVIQVSSQDVINPYQNLPTYPSHQISGSGPGQTFQTSYNLELGGIGYNGEYQVFPNLLGNWGNQAWHKTIEIETVSFPFTPQNECAFSANGCTSSVPERILSMPISAYDPITRAWGEILKAVVNRN